MKRIVLSVMAIFLCLSLHGQNVIITRGDQPVNRPEWQWFLMPYIGYSGHFAAGDDPAWQYSQVMDPDNHPDWDGYLDGISLYHQPVDYWLSPSVNYGLEFGRTVSESHRNGKAIAFFAFGYEYQEREFRSIQSYFNGTLTGETVFEGTERKHTYRVNAGVIWRQIGFTFGFWCRFNSYPERTVTFNSYRDGDLEFTQLLYPNSGNPASESYNEHWRNDYASAGVSIAFNYQPTDYTRFFVRYEFNHVSGTKPYSGYLGEIVLRNGFNTHSVMLGLGIPICF